MESIVKKQAHTAGVVESTKQQQLSIAQTLTCPTTTTQPRSTRHHDLQNDHVGLFIQEKTKDFVKHYAVDRGILT